MLCTTTSILSTSLDFALGKELEFSNIERSICACEAKLEAKKCSLSQVKGVLF